MTKRQKTPKGPITAATRIDEMLRHHPATAAVLERYGLNCSDCALIAMATVALGAERHHLDREGLLKDLNRAATGT